MAASSPLQNADAPCRYFKSAFRPRWRGLLRTQRPRRRACMEEYIRTTVRSGRDGDVPMQGSSPLTTRHRYAFPQRGRERAARTSSTHGSLRATFQVTASVLSQRPAHTNGRVLVPVAPRLTQPTSSGEGDRSGAPTPGPNHPLQPVQAATHPTFQVDRQGERAI